MSYFSLVNLVLFFFILPCIFFWHPWCLLILLIMWSLLVINFIVWDVNEIVSNHRLSFWLFIASEVMIFGSIIFSCLWFQKFGSVAIAYPYFIPIIETFMLLISSVFVSAYHYNLSSADSYIYLYMSIVSSIIFMFLAIYEIINSFASVLYSPFYASCYMLIGLHFSHVLIGTIGLCLLLKTAIASFIRHGFEMIIIYWHFVDSVWLVVFLVVYILGNM